MTTTITEPSPPEDDALDAPAPAAPERKAGPRTGATLWLLARRIHFMAGLLVAPFLAVLCLTGLAYAFTPQINGAIYGHELFAGDHNGPALPLSEQVNAALAAHPDGTLKSVLPPADADHTTQVVLSTPGLKPGDAFSAEALTVYVDPYSAQVRGALVTVSGRPPAQTWLREFHGNLHLGTPGRLYSEFVASWLPWIVLGGLVLWLGRRGRARRLRELVIPRRSATGRARLRGVHGALGLWLSLGLLAVSITGLTWSNYAGAHISDAMTALNGKSPSLTAPKIVPSKDGTPIGIDRVLDIARHEGLDGQLTITPPAAKDKPYKVSESFETLPVHKDSIAIDPYTGQVSGKVTWADYPFLAKLTSLGIQAHSGTLLGLPNQIAMAMLALGTLTLLTIGYRMWWQRRPTRGSRAPAQAPVWRQLPQPVVFGIVLVIAALAWALPVFGVSLLGFLMVDAARTTIRRRRDSESATPVTTA